MGNEFVDRPRDFDHPKTCDRVTEQVYKNNNVGTEMCRHTCTVILESMLYI